MFAKKYKKNHKEKGKSKLINQVSAEIIILKKYLKLIKDGDKLKNKYTKLKETYKLWNKKLGS